MHRKKHILGFTLLAGLTAGCSQPAPAPVPSDTVPVSVLEEAQAQIKSVRADLEAERAQRNLLEEQLNNLTQESDELIHQLMSDVAEEKSRAELAKAASEEEKEGVYPDEITFQTGTKTRCRVLGVVDGILNVQLPTGEKKMARLSSVASARVRTEANAERAVDENWVPAPGPEPANRIFPSFSTDGLKLSSFWNIPVPASTQKTADLQRLLKEHGTPDDDLTPKLGAELYKGVYYLMPMNQAVEALGLTGSAPRRQLGTAGFPQKSLTYYEYKGSFDDRFDKLLLVTDLDSQVVAIQLVESNPIGVFLRSSIYERPDSSWHLFNLVEGRTKGRSESGVNYRVKRISENMLRIDSEYTNSKRETRECNRLFIPQPLVDLILHLIQTKY